MTVLETLQALAGMGYGDYTIWELIDKIEHSEKTGN